MGVMHHMRSIGIGVLAAAFSTLMAFAPWSRAAVPATRPAQPPAPAVAALLEDNAETLLPLLTNPTGDPGQGYVERFEVYSGTSAVKIVPMQRFHPNIPGWKYRIVEKPAGPDEYRYLRFAWKSHGCVGTMLQLHDANDWSLRYTAGADVPGWGSKLVAPAAPARWVIVTRDLFADFGQRTITGIALTAFGGEAAYFDHIYFGRTVEELDRIDVTGVRDDGPVKLGAAEMESLWTDLTGDDAPVAYRA